MGGDPGEDSRGDEAGDGSSVSFWPNQLSLGQTASSRTVRLKFPTAFREKPLVLAAIRQIDTTPTDDEHVKFEVITPPEKEYLKLAVSAMSLTTYNGSISRSRRRVILVVLPLNHEPQRDGTNLH